jgi:CRP-like cAMP-binding protein
VVAATPVRCLEIDREAFKLVLEKNQQVIDIVRAVFEQRAVADKMQQVVTESLFERFRKLFL